MDHMAAVSRRLWLALSWTVTTPRACFRSTSTRGAPLEQVGGESDAMHHGLPSLARHTSTPKSSAISCSFYDGRYTCAVYLSIPPAGLIIMGPRYLGRFMKLF